MGRAYKPHPAVTVKELISPIQHLRVNSYERLLQTVGERARFGEAEYIAISQQLGGLDPHQLEEQGSFWHRKCYADATNKTNRERLKNRYLKVVAQGDTTDLLKIKGRPSATPQGQSSLQPDADIRVTRSSIPLYNKELCVFFFYVKSSHLKSYACADQKTLENNMHYCQEM